MQIKTAVLILFCSRGTVQHSEVVPTGQELSLVCWQMHRTEVSPTQFDSENLPLSELCFPVFTCSRTSLFLSHTCFLFEHKREKIELDSPGHLFRSRQLRKFLGCFQYGFMNRSLFWKSSWRYEFGASSSPPPLHFWKPPVFLLLEFRNPPKRSKHSLLVKLSSQILEQRRGREDPEMPLTFPNSLQCIMLMPLQKAS